MNKRLYEEKHLKETIQLITAEKSILKKQQEELNNQLQEQLKETSDKKINIGNEEAFYNSVLEYQQHELELKLRYQSVDSQEKRLATLEKMKKNPYFARIDFQENSEERETLYLGIASLRDKEDETIVIDWRAPIANLYYEGELGPTFYETQNEHFDVELLLKRQFKIQDSQIISIVDTSEIINDEFLLEILDDVSSSQMKNIVSTIQKAQNEIIRDIQSKVLLIEGIAGSGKTSALLQRIAFLMYHHRKWLEDDQVLLFSPNHLFSDYISLVLPSLGESEVPTRIFKDYMSELLPNYTIIQEEKQEAHFLMGSHQPVATFKQGLDLVEAIPRYIQKITSLGPIFRDLKINGEIYLSKQKIRQWYQETNPNLPLYQRSSLLQTKLLKKVAGLERDEMKKEWLIEEAKEKLHELFENDPQQDYTEENERRLLKKFRQEIARKKFIRLHRLVKQFQFINYPMQYLHFLKEVPTTTLKKINLDTEVWQNSLTQIKEHFKKREIQQEDTVLYFLLMTHLRPVSIKQKARFIFIDEMQDFPPAQIALLRQLYPQANMTLCGDLNQKIFGNETIVDSLDRVFPEQNVTRYQLTTSYRSTKEITDFANQLLSFDDSVKTTARNGEKPKVINTKNENEALDVLQQLVQQANHTKYWRTAIIAKTSEECITLYNALSEADKLQVQLITSEKEHMRRPIMIIPAFLAKGLEFDRVIAWNISDNFKTAQDQLVLYTIATRAMHELTLIHRQPDSPLLKNIDTKTFTSI